MKDEAVDTTFQGQMISRITWTGLKTTSPHLLQREFIHQVGKPFNYRILSLEKQRLSKYDHISTINTNILRDTLGVHLSWEIHEIPPILITPDWFYSEMDGLSVGCAVSCSNIDGLGGKIGLSGLFGKNRSYDFTFDHPWLFGRRVGIGISTKISYSYQRNVQSQQYERFTEMEQWITGKSLEYYRYSLGLGGIQSKSQTATKFNDDASIFWVGARFRYDRRNQNIGTTKGLWFETQYQYYCGTHLFHHGLVDVRYWQPIYKPMYLLQTGLIQVQDRTTLQGLPTFRLFHIGGMNTVRGYRIHDIGTNQTGVNEYILTSELRLPILPTFVLSSFGYQIQNRLELATFFDIGSAWNSCLVHSKRILGGGFGFRWIAPLIYEARLDLGINENGNTMYHFGLQTKSTMQRKRNR
ncbi:MAG: BamA/TamA family outer membrane protein [bacterium]|nr:BamA/TamA family outer membrane protein [bacterium]